MDVQKRLENYLVLSKSPIDRSREGCEKFSRYLEKVQDSISKGLGCISELGDLHQKAMRQPGLMKDKSWQIHVSLILGAIQTGTKQAIIELLEIPPGCGELYFFASKILSEMNDMAVSYESAIKGNQKGFKEADLHRENISEYAEKLADSFTKFGQAHLYGNNI
jgi:hypothetical protein